MTRSERARWTDLQVLAFLWSFDEDGNHLATSCDDAVLTTRDVATALGISVGRAAHALARLRREQVAMHGSFGWSIPIKWTKARANLSGAGFCDRRGPVITYPCDTEAA